MSKLPDHYSLKGETDKDYEVHDERDGTSFRVAKMGLHPARQMNILRMKKYDDGGQVRPGLEIEIDKLKQRYEPQFEMYQAPLGPVAPPVDIPMSSIPSPVIDQNLLAANEPQIEVASPGTEIAPQPIPSVSVSPAVTGNVGENGIMQEARGQVEQQKQMANIYDQHVKAEQQRAETFASSMKNYQEQADQLSRDIAASKVDAGQYWGSKDTGSKIATGIGVMLAGIGQGLAGSNSNSAMDFLNRQIDRDIDAQKAMLGKRQTMFSDNLKLQGNMMAAEAATRAQMSSILQGQISKIAAQTNSPIIMGQAQQKLDVLRRQQMLDMATVAKNQAAQVPSPMGSGPESQAFGKVPPALREKAIEEVASVKAIRSALIQADTVLEDIFKTNSVANRVMSPIQSKALIATAEAKLMPIVKKIIDERMTDADARTMIRPYVSGILENSSTKDKKKQDMFSALLAKLPEKTPILTMYGGFDPSSIKADAAPEVQRGKDGRMYQKVPGGWVPIK